MIEELKLDGMEGSDGEGEGKYDVLGGGDEDVQSIKFTCTNKLLVIIIVPMVNKK